jgi:hypothetical protein
MRKSWPSIVLAALILQIPFEFRNEVFGLSNLQWTFVALVVVSTPLLIHNWKSLILYRPVQAGLAFIIIQWFTAFLAPEFQSNAIKAAVRFSAGMCLFTISLILAKKHAAFVKAAWITAAAAAAIYGLVSYIGFGIPSLFRSEEFYIGQIQRLSGSFEYPNTAAAYFAMSIPIVWWSGIRSWLKWPIAFCLWCAVILTFSRGALLAIPAVIAVGMIAARSRRNYWRSAAAIVALGIGCYALLLPWNPYWIERLYGPGIHNPTAAEYNTAWNHLRQQPNSVDEIPIEVRNIGIRTWRSGGLRRDAIAYRWWNIASEMFLPGNAIVTALPHDIHRGEAIHLQPRFQTPTEPGQYLLVVELFNGDYDWLSRKGVIPALVKVDVEPNVARSTDEINMSAFYHRRQMPQEFTASVPRLDLWKAALAITMKHPLGIGPDNYRLEYGKYLGAARWNTHVYSNNLFLEILTGSGILGLAAFAWLLTAYPWRFDGGHLSIGIFLIHGFVDVFLMTTPIYFAFWFLLGTQSERNPD